MSRLVTKSPLIGLIIEKGEKERLRQACLAHNTPILYPELFANKKHYSLWAFTQDGIGLVGTVIMSHLDVILRGVEQLQAYLQREAN